MVGFRGLAFLILFSLTACDGDTGAIGQVGTTGSTGTAVSTSADDSGCGSSSVTDCEGGCSPASWLSDGYCDDSLNCDEHAFDKGDCPL